jgi:hypothetical protein
MKKYLSIFLLLLLSAGALISCKKDNKPKDLRASFADKTWSGSMTYTGLDAEYYSVRFNNDNTLSWSQFSGDYSGTWQLTDHLLTMSFDVSGVEIKAGVSDDQKLSGFVVKNTNSYKINTCAPLNDPNPSLDNTVWEGSLQKSTVTEKYVMSFKPGSQIILDIEGSVLPQTGVYERLKSGGGIRVSFAVPKFIGVITANKEMRGILGLGTTRYPWAATKK